MFIFKHKLTEHKHNLQCFLSFFLSFLTCGFPTGNQSMYAFKTLNTRLLLGRNQGIKF